MTKTATEEWPRQIPGYWTVRELSEATGLTQATIRWHCRRGQLRFVALATGRDWLIPDGPVVAVFIDR